MFDAAAVTTAVQTADQADAQQTAVNHAPSLSADAAQVSHTVTDSVASGSPLFSNALADANDTDQRFDSLWVTIDSSGSHEALIIDGTQILLSPNSGSTSGGKDYAYTVTTSGGSTTVDIVLASTTANSAADLKALVESIRYQTLDGTLENGSRTITLTQVRDDGGTADGGSDTTSLSISATVNLVSGVNRAPVRCARDGNRCCSGSVHRSGRPADGPGR